MAFEQNTHVEQDTHAEQIKQPFSTIDNINGNLIELGKIDPDNKGLEYIKKICSGLPEGSVALGDTYRKLVAIQEDVKGIKKEEIVKIGKLKTGLGAGLEQSENDEALKKALGDIENIAL